MACVMGKGRAWNSQSMMRGAGGGQTDAVMAFSKEVRTERGHGGGAARRVARTVEGLLVSHPHRPFIFTLLGSVNTYMWSIVPHNG